MENTVYEAMAKALGTAREKLNQASYLAESGSNSGLRQMNANKAEWLKWVVYLAEQGLEMINAESKEATVKEETLCEACPVTTEALKLLGIKDTIIEELTAKAEDITMELESLQLTYNCELECRKSLITKAKIDYFTEILESVHNNCWLDGTVLVTPVESLDKELLQLIKE